MILNLKDIVSVFPEKYKQQLGSLMSLVHTYTAFDSTRQSGTDRTENKLFQNR